MLCAALYLAHNPAVNWAEVFSIWHSCLRENHTTLALIASI